jgi:hypothetical protein
MQSHSEVPEGSSSTYKWGKLITRKNKEKQGQGGKFRDVTTLRV